MMSFDGYSFCKPHSASYARVSFQAAYLKTHFPAEFMAAVISWTFPMIAATSGGHAFAFYTLCMVAQLVWVIFVMPETKRVTLEQIQREFEIE